MSWKGCVVIKRDESGAVTITGSDIETYRVMVIRRGLILKIDTGVSLSRVSCLSAAQRSGLTSQRTHRGALVDVNAWLGEHGVSPSWSRTYPQG